MSTKKTNPRVFVVDLICPRCLKTARGILNGAPQACPECGHEYFQLRDRKPLEFCSICGMKTQTVENGSVVAHVCSRCGIFGLPDLVDSTLQATLKTLAPSGFRKEAVCSSCSLPLVESEYNVLGSKILFCYRCAAPDLWMTVDALPSLLELSSENQEVVDLLNKVKDVL